MLTKNHINLLFQFFCAISFYSYGTAMMDYFLLYPSRFLVGENEFIAYHKLLESAIYPISVIPFLIIVLLNALLLWFRPERVSKNLLVLSLVCLVLDLFSTIFFQARRNIALANGKDVALMQKITDTNWGRVFLESAQVVVVLIMMVRRDSGHAYKA
ncbi:MAG TPA: hypothetical protein VD816_12360 [Ohtaekwangia sp.]|nr:hypothetical protein [Ohtaekwangia sp.]